MTRRNLETQFPPSDAPNTFAIQVKHPGEHWYSVGMITRSNDIWQANFGLWGENWTLHDPSLTQLQNKVANVLIDLNKKHARDAEKSI